MTGRRLPWLIVVLAVGLSACKDDAVEKPVAQRLTPEALGHYCQMEVLEHDGPKAQVHLAGFEAPVWFAQVRDAIAYMRLEEQSHPVAAIYVSDMANASSWAEPGIDNWVDAEAAFFVVGSTATGGMGAPEVVPFGDETAAQNFRNTRGGEVVRLEGIPTSAVLGEVEVVFPATGGE